jgi:hypothetical protein
MGLIVISSFYLTGGQIIIDLVAAKGQRLPKSNAAVTLLCNIVLLTGLFQVLLSIRQ